MNEWTEVCLNDIDIDDEAMDNWETFNEKYHQLLNLHLPNPSIELNSEDNKAHEEICSYQQMSLFNNNHASLNSTEIFSLDKYLERIMGNNYTKPKLSQLMKEMSKLSNHNIKVLPILKSIKSNSSKSEYIKAIITIIHILLK